MYKIKLLKRNWNVTELSSHIHNIVKWEWTYSAKIFINTSAWYPSDVRTWCGSVIWRKTGDIWKNGRIPAARRCTRWFSPFLIHITLLCQQIRTRPSTSRHPDSRRRTTRYFPILIMVFLTRGTPRFSSTRENTLHYFITIVRM